MNRRSFHKFAAAWAAAAALPKAGMANTGSFQAPLNMLVGFAAGGALDIAARRIGPEMSSRIGQPVVVENYAGASGGIAVQRLLRSRADGSTVFYGSPNEVILAPYAIKSLNYRPADLELAGVGAWTSLVLCGRSSLDASNIDELIAFNRSNAALSFASVGIGSLQHLAGESLRSVSGMNLLHVPYKGTTPGLNDLLGGQIDLAVLTLAGNTPALINSGKIKSFGVMAVKRDPAVPNLPTINEGKTVKDIDFTIWGGLFAPAGTPRPVLEALNATMRDVHAIPQISSAIKDAGSNPPEVRTLDETREFFVGETKKFEAIAKSISFSS